MLDNLIAIGGVVTVVTVIGAMLAIRLVLRIAAGIIKAVIATFVRLVFIGVALVALFVLFLIGAANMVFGGAA
jgi:hypothetical protein